jgi:hypothetical protein
MQRNMTELKWSQLMPATPSRALGVVLIAISLLRWPATAMLVSSGWEPANSPWVMILAVQSSAEIVFWVGAWLVGRDFLRAALARVAGNSSIRTIVDWVSRVARTASPKSGVTGV